MNPSLKLTPPEKHKVFVSFHSADMHYRNEFDRLYGQHFVSASVDLGDINPETEDEYIKRMIQQDHIVQSSVVFALYGSETYKRKHVDWEISGGLSGRVGGHKGLVVLLLPEFPQPPYDINKNYNPSLIYPYLHPRTAANVRSGYASLHYWPGLYLDYPNVTDSPITKIIEDAFTRRKSHSRLIDNSHPQYVRNL